MISTITATQRFNALHPAIRVNATELFVDRLRNMQDLDTCIEVSAVVGKNTLMELYRTATIVPYRFLYIQLIATDKDELFSQTFDKTR